MPCEAAAIALALLLFAAPAHAEIVALPAVTCRLPNAKDGSIQMRTFELPGFWIDRPFLNNTLETAAELRACTGRFKDCEKRREPASPVIWGAIGVIVGAFAAIGISEIAK